MNKPRRLSTRRLMAIVAIAGLVVAIGIEGERRRVRFLQIANAHSEWDRMWFGRDNRVAERVTVEKGQWRMLMEQKYRRAAQFPWFPVWPDPPEPP